MKSNLLVLLSIMALSCLSATQHKKGTQITPNITQTEIGDLTSLLVRYGNNPEGIPALHYAILQNDIEAVDLLLKFGAHPLTKSRKAGCSDCLHCCIRAGNLELFKKFVDLGNDPTNTLTSFDENPLRRAISYHRNDIAKFILEFSNDDLDEEEDLKYSRFRNNLLLDCSWFGNYEIFEILLDRYKNLEIDYTLCIDRALERFQIGDGEMDGPFPDEQAVIQGRFKILDTLTKQGHLSWFNNEYEARNVLANSFPEALAYLLDHKILHPDSLVGNCPLLLAAAQHSFYSNEMVEVLLARGVDVQKGKCKYALFAVIDGGPFSKQVLKQKKALILTLLNAGIDINLKDQTGRSAAELTKDQNIREFLKNLEVK